MYIEARRLRHIPQVLERLGYPRRVSLGSVSPHPAHALEIVQRYLTSTSWFQRGLRPVPVTLDDGEIAMLEEAQRWLRWLLGHQEITIESNPSSNLLTSDLGMQEAPPALRLTLGPAQRDGKTPRWRRARSSEAPLLVSINTDDPITFATRLADEYAYFYSGLLQAHLTAQEALAWVERVRFAGWRSRFTLPGSSDPIGLQELVSRWRAVLKPWSRKLRLSFGHEGSEQQAQEELDPAPLTAPSEVPPRQALSTYWEIVSGSNPWRSLTGGSGIQSIVDAVGLLS
jgi:hypothetical protein